MEEGIIKLEDVAQVIVRHLTLKINIKNCVG